MNAALPVSDLDRAIATATGRIAPAWPLDRLIAVNPYWGFVEQPVEEAAGHLAALCGTSLLMPRAWYAARWREGRFTVRHLERAAQAAGSRRTPPELVRMLDEPAPALVRGRLVTDLADEGRDPGHAPTFTAFVTEHLSQACAACFDDGQAAWGPARTEGLYAVWRTLAQRDLGPRLRMGLRGFRAAVNALPAEPRALVAEALDALAVPDDARADYLAALLLSVGGWAASCAFRRWEARLHGGDDEEIVGLLASRLAWELVLVRLGSGEDLATRWGQGRRTWAAAAASARAARRDDWIVHHALELAYGEALAQGLRGPARAAPVGPAVQAVFCIDVRSEVFRRALEGVGPEVQTLGFAGFFGLPVAYRPLTGPPRPQLPGLLAPSLQVEDVGPGRVAAVAAAREAVGLQVAWKALGSTAASAFSFVEGAGLGSVVGLARDGLGLGRRTGDLLRAPATHADADLRPLLTRRVDGGAPLGLEARVDLAAGILRGMSLREGFAPVLALFGHGASSENNPQLAGLHCGACGGQTGEVNARALAALLNHPEVRRGLAAQGIHLDGTHVVAGLHDTTTDDVALFDLDLVPTSHRPHVEALQRQLTAAGAAARAERARGLGLDHLKGARLDAAVRARATDASQVRPEWGLAGNAAFVVAPRGRTRGVDLGGRAFLHEYRWDRDEGFAVLEGILTAPMVVTHWINMQYNASTVDPDRFGSGNKVLHNVVGGRLGVFEGAGGDLRIGLARQSVHDGTRWVHEPLRLTVVVEAPAEALEGILQRQEVVRRLVAGAWVHLLRIDPVDGRVWRWWAEGWREED